MFSIIDRVAKHTLDELKDVPVVIESTRAYKRLTGLKRIPLAMLNGEPVFGNELLDKYDLKIGSKAYMSDAEADKLFSGEVVIEEKVDGHPQILLWKGYSWFGENLNYVHTVKYDIMPEPSPTTYSNEIVFPRNVMIYDIKVGENYKAKGRWLTRPQKVKMCRKEGAPLVSVLYSGRLTPDRLPKVAQGLSAFGTEQREGVVVKNLKYGIFGKFINLEFQKAISDDEIGDIHPELRRERHPIRDRKMMW
jgi:hypothetical protein